MTFLVLHFVVPGRSRSAASHRRSSVGRSAREDGLRSILPRAQGLLHLWPRCDQRLPEEESVAVDDPIA